jgi:GDPmannose 4,6-dehydratase
LEKGYEVHGLIRRSSTFNTSRIDHLFKDPHDETNHLHLHYGDLTDAAGMTNLIRQIQPEEVYNLAAQSHVMVSFSMPTYTANVDAVGTTTLLEAIRSSGLKTKFYQASTSELFGKTPPPQNELSRFHPRSPYGAAKLYAYWVTINYREAYGIHATNGILFNHESPRRGETFVTRKISRAVAAIAHGSQEKLYLGNLDAIRDWGYAKEYVESMWLMLQEDKPDDFVIATGVGATIREFCEVAFNRVGLDWENYTLLDERYIRPSEVDALVGDPSKAKRQLKWEAKTHWRELAQLMVDADLKS